MTTLPREHLRVELIEGVAIVHFLDRELTEPYDNPEAREVSHQLDSLVDDGGYTMLLLDLRDVEWLSTYILAKLVDLKRKIEDLGGRLRLCGVEAHLVRELFRISALDRVFAIDPDEHAALDAFRRIESGGHRPRGTSLGRPS